MGKILITTKETNKKYVKLSLTAAFIPLILGNLMGLMGIALMVMSKETSGISVFCLFFGIAGAAYGGYRGFRSLADGKTYLDFYDEYIQGIGLINNSPNSFKISLTEVANITANGTMINLHTNSGIYKIITDVETAKKVVELYQNKKFN